MYYIGRQGAQYTLGNRLGGGGEGDVYEVQGHPDLVAKVYNTGRLVAGQRQNLKDKIETMLDQPVMPYIGDVLSVAWPQDTLQNQGQFTGYVMPKVHSRYHIYAACRMRERVVLYRKYTWKTALTIGYNLALAVKTVHRTGAVIGDFNPNNIMINEKGHVTLIDTDSFCVINRRTNQKYQCTVGVPEVLAPELQGKNLARPNNAFSQESDNFALAIHIFNLLMNNCHPFGCSGLNKSQSSTSHNPIEKNIVKGTCPYVTNGTGERSPDAPGAGFLPPVLQGLFDRAFTYDTRSALSDTVKHARPRAEEWQNALKNVLFGGGLSVCPANASHVYPSHMAGCPWCVMQSFSVGTVPTLSRIQNLPLTQNAAHNATMGPIGITPPNTQSTAATKNPMDVKSILSSLFGKHNTP